MTSYSDIAASFRACPREIQTAPRNGQKPKWFSVYEHGGDVYVSSGSAHENASRICPDRRLPKKELPFMLELYHRREMGEPVSAEAGRSVNQSYWYGIFKDLNL